MRRLPPRSHFPLPFSLQLSIAQSLTRPRPRPRPRSFSSSTIPEVIAARHAGVRVLVLSLVTNIVVNHPYRSAEAELDAEQEQAGAGAQAGGVTALARQTQVREREEEEEVVASHQEVLDVSAKRADDVRALVEKVVDALGKEEE